GFIGIHPAVKKIAILVVPTVVSIAVSQINIFVSTIIASFLPEGSITYLYYSMRLIQLPIGIFGVAVGMAVLPTLSQHVAEKNFDKLKEELNFSLRLLFFLTIPSMFGLMMLSQPIVNTLFQRGVFDYIATLNTAQALLFYSIGIWATVGSRTITVAYYSLQDTKTPVLCATVAMFTNIGVSLIFIKTLKHNGIALAYSVAAITQFFLLNVLLKSKLPQFNLSSIFPSLFKTLVASAAAVVLAKLICMIKPEIWISSNKIILKVIILSTAILTAVFVYLFMCYLLKHEELGYILRKLRRKL
ncbi:MAG: lipid II flippase MurJ, partial [Thermodesulfovibrionaceae bacterium]